MLYLIGLGLSDEKDVTVRGLEAIKGSERVYLEAYTSILGVGKERLVCTSYLGACSTTAQVTACVEAGAAPKWPKFCAESMLLARRKPSMAKTSSSLIVTWSRRNRMIFSPTLTAKTSRFSLSVILSGACDVSHHVKDTNLTCKLSSEPPHTPTCFCAPTSGKFLTP